MERRHTLLILGKYSLIFMYGESARVLNMWDTVVLRTKKGYITFTGFANKNILSQVVFKLDSFLVAMTFSARF